MGNNTRVTFFSPECPQAIETMVGSNWEFQNQNPEQRSKDYINELGRDGDEILSRLVNGKTATGWQFVFKADTGTLVTASIKVGAVVGGYHIDSVEISGANTQIHPKMTIIGHAHDGVQNGHNTCRTYKPTVSISGCAFGVPSNLGAVSLKQTAEVDFRSFTYRLSVTHIDEQARDGGELKGDNHDGVETMSVEFTGDATSSDYEITNGWSVPTSQKTPSNTGVTTSSLELVKHISHETVSAQS